jgi:hypothetical protein
MVEASLIFVPTFAILFGILDFSIAIFLRSTLQHACREGVRYAVTYQTISGSGHDASIQSVVQANAMGFLAGESGREKIRIRYYTPDTYEETSLNAPNNVVEVSIEDFEWGWIAPLMRSATPLRMGARATDRMEGLPGGSQPPAR